MQENIKLKQDVVYGYRSGMALTFDILQPKHRNGAAVLFFNSGGFYSLVFVRQDPDLAGSRWLFFQATQENKIVDLGLQFSFAPLLDNGFTVFDIRHCSSPICTLEEIVEDCRTAIRFIHSNAQDYGIDPDRIGAWGMSAGGYLAVLVLKMDLATLDGLSLKRRISGDEPPALIIYGEEDSDFITGPSEALYAVMQEKGVESRRIAIPETGHLFLGKDDHFNGRAGEYAMSELLHWFQKHLVTWR